MTLTTSAPSLTRGTGHVVVLDAFIRRSSAILLALSLGLVTWWWADGNGLTDLGGWATGLTSLGRLTGLLASLLLLVQVLLMARLPSLEQAFGQDRLARLHRLVGFSSFNLMLAHLGLISWGYAAGSLSGLPATFWQLTVTYPGMLLALAGTIALCLVVVTSIRAARSALRYESWHLLHLYAYLGVGLALPHQLWTGQEFLASPGRTVFWWGLWAAAALSVVIFRVLVPLWRSRRHQLRVTSVVEEGDGVFSVYLTGHRLDRLRVRAGQFLHWRFLAGPGWSRAHPYSLSAAPDGRSLRISVKRAGDGSSELAHVRPGTPVVVEGPYGRLSERARSRHKVLLIGAGVGVTPLRALAEGLGYEPGDATLLYRYRDEPLFVEELQQLRSERGLQVVGLPGRRRRSSWLPVGAGHDLDVLRQLVPDVAERDVFICGPDVWAGQVRRTLEQAGCPRRNIHVESFGW